MNRLPFVGEVAPRLADVLEERGGWWPAAGGLVLDPSADELQSQVTEAFAQAEASGAALLLAFVGHGIAIGEEFYFLTRDAPGEIRADSSDRVLNWYDEEGFGLAGSLGELLARSVSLDGLVVLVDACQADPVRRAAVRDWTDVLRDNRGRMEVLVASAKGSAYGGCFTRTILASAESGLKLGGDNLLCSRLRIEIANQCTALPQYSAYDNSIPTDGDPGLWLVRNEARAGDAVSGRPAAGLVDQLTAGVVVTDPMRNLLGQLEEPTRLRLVVGDPGAGKSTLMGLLIRPEHVDTISIRSGYIKAAIFLDSSSTLDGLATELSTQLDRMYPPSTDYPGFAAQIADAEAELEESQLHQLSLWKRLVEMPLARMVGPGVKIPIIVDGLDQPEEGARNQIIDVLSLLGKDPTYRHVRMIVGVRADRGIDTDERLQYGERVEVPSPSLDDIAAALQRISHPHTGYSREQLADLLGDDATGGWLLARLISETSRHLGQMSGEVSLEKLIILRSELAMTPHIGADVILTGRILDLLTAAGVGPTLPIRLIAESLGDDSRPLPLARVRNCLPVLGALISRGKPGTEVETLGIAHQSYYDPLAARDHTTRSGLNWAHQTLIDGMDRYFKRLQTIGADDIILQYWLRAAPRHFLGVGNSATAYEFLQHRESETGSSAQNRDRWATWLPEFRNSVGDHHRDTLAVRIQITKNRGEAGDIAGAIRESSVLVQDCTRLLGPDDELTLGARGNLATWRAELGDIGAAMEQYEAILADRIRVFGSNHRFTLAVRNRLAKCRGESGDISGAIADYEELIADEEILLEPNDEEALAARNNLAYLLNAAGHTVQALQQQTRVLADLEAAFGRKHRRTISSRGILSHLTARAGDINGAIAIATEVVADSAEVLGDDHPETMQSRAGLASLLGKAGKITAAIDQYNRVITDRIRILGGDHPDTLVAQSDLAFLLAAIGEIDDAVELNIKVLSSRMYLLGPNHQETLTTRNAIASLRADAGRTSEALDDFVSLLADQERILGHHHPHTLTTRSNIASVYVDSGDLNRAIHEYRKLLEDEERILGADNLQCLQTRVKLAYALANDGNNAEAILHVEIVRLDRQRILGPEHPDSLAIRGDRAQLLARSGNLLGAISAYEQLIADRRRIRGHDDEATAALRESLAYVKRVQKLVE